MCEEEEEEKKKRARYLLSVVSVSTFNIKGTVQNNEYKGFLMNAFSRLRSNLHHIQECIWSQRGVWIKESILSGYKIRISPSGDAGLASHIMFLKQQGPPSGMRNPFPKRVCCLKFSTKINFEVVKHEMGLPSVEESDKILEFLSFSYHGYHKVPKEHKIMHIKKCINFVGKCCRAEKLPAIIGGDFNFNIRKIDWTSQDKIKIFGGTSSRHRSIDFLCTVCEDAFETKMVMLPFVGYLDIDKVVPLEVCGRITNHVPYFGNICLFKELESNE